MRLLANDYDQIKINTRGYSVDGLSTKIRQKDETGWCYVFSFRNTYINISNEYSPMNMLGQTITIEYEDIPSVINRLQEMYDAHRTQPDI